MTHLLELTTLDRPTISIDNQSYPLMRPEDFGLVESVRLSRLRQQVADALADTRQDEAAAQALGRALEEMVQMLLPETPAAVLARLRDGQRLTIVRCFSMLVPSRGPTAPTA